MFDADRPITSSKQDKLNRSLFSKYLARCMLDHKDPNSLVVGLYGGWGTGKTSIINMVVEELKFAASNMFDDEKPIILNFSPWSYSGQDQLIYNFFRRLSSTIRNEPNLKNADRIIHLLELYVSFFTHKPIPTSFQTKKPWYKKLSPSKNEEVYGWESGRDLTLVKAELNELLLQQKRKIIIIIDNISRLLSKEIMQIFQIVKSMGDYTNTVYLLAFDKAQVVDSLNHEDTDGEEYVEKIVQLPFEIPPITEQDLEAILADRLSDVLITVPEGAWDAEYWNDIYHSSLKFFFKNCRDITRYVNTINFGYSRLRDIVNPVDFFALTAIEIFTPTVYFGIRDNKDLFTDLLDNVFIPNTLEEKKERSRCDDILSRNDRVDRKLLLSMIMFMFPRIRHLYEPKHRVYHSPALARKLRRICSPDLFDAYFRLSLQFGQLPKTEFDMLLATANNMDEFDQTLTRLNQDDKIIAFLDKLDSGIIDQIPAENIAIIISGLFNNGDFFPAGVTGPFNLNTQKRLHRIIHQLLQRLDSADERFTILQNAIAHTAKSLYTSVHELQEQARDHQESESTFLPIEYRDVTPEQLDSLRSLAITRIEQWANSGALTDNPYLMPLLLAWSEWGGAIKCKEYVEHITHTDRGLVVFLTAVLDEPITQTMTQYQKNPEWIKYLDVITTFVDIKLLEPHAKILFEDDHFEKLREREQLGIMIFLDLINADTKKVIPKTSD